MRDYELYERHVYRAEDGMPFWVLVVNDDDPQQPENDGGCPVFEVGVSEATHTGYGAYYAKDHQDRLLECLSKFVYEHGRRKGIDTFERYVAIFHGGQITECYGSDGPYVAVVTQTLWQEWGNTNPMPTDVVEMTEWRAWLDGEVYGYILLQGHRLCVCDTCRDLEDLDELGSCWGFYGEGEYAHEAGAEEVQCYIRDYNENLKGVMAA